MYNKEGSGVQVDSKLSVQGRLVLLNMSESGQGLYKCEVTGPAPVYHTATTVQVQDNTLTEVMWFIDGYTAPSSWVKTEFNRSLITIRQGMLGRVVVRCVARVDQMYWGAGEAVVDVGMDEGYGYG